MEELVGGGGCAGGGHHPTGQLTGRVIDSRIGAAAGFNIAREIPTSLVHPGCSGIARVRAQL